MNKIISIAALVAALFLQSACSDIEHSAGMAFGNANSVVRSGGDNMWSSADSQSEKDQKTEEQKKTTAGEKY